MATLNQTNIDARIEALNTTIETSVRTLTNSSNDRTLRAKNETIPGTSTQASLNSPQSLIVLTENSFAPGNNANIAAIRELDGEIASSTSLKEIKEKLGQKAEAIIKAEAKTYGLSLTGDERLARKDLLVSTWEKEALTDSRIKAAAQGTEPKGMAALVAKVSHPGTHVAPAQAEEAPKKPLSELSADDRVRAMKDFIAKQADGSFAKVPNGNKQLEVMQAQYDSLEIVARDSLGKITDPAQIALMHQQAIAKLSNKQATPNIPDDQRTTALQMLNDANKGVSPKQAQPATQAAKPAQPARPAHPDTQEVTYPRAMVSRYDAAADTLMASRDFQALIEYRSTQQKRMAIMAQLRALDNATPPDFELPSTIQGITTAHNQLPEGKQFKPKNAQPAVGTAAGGGRGSYAGYDATADAASKGKSGFPATRPMTTGDDHAPSPHQPGNVAKVRGIGGGIIFSGTLGAAAAGATTLLMTGDAQASLDSAKGAAVDAVPGVRGQAARAAGRTTEAWVADVGDTFGNVVPGVGVLAEELTRAGLRLGGNNQADPGVIMSTLGAVRDGADALNKVFLAKIGITGGDTVATHAGSATATAGKAPAAATAANVSK